MAKSPPPGSGYNEVKVNVLIMLDRSGSMSYTLEGGWTPTPATPIRPAAPRGESRLDYAKDVIKNIVSNSALTAGANFGLLTWSGSESNNVLDVPVSEDGATEIIDIIDTLTPRGGTKLGMAMTLAEEYMSGKLSGIDSPIDTSLSDCQKTIIIVISDGEWTDHVLALDKTKKLYDNRNVKTFAVGFTDGAAGSLQNYIDISEAGQTRPDSPAFADDYSALYDSLSSFILMSIQSNITFSSPTIIPDVAGDDHIIQATFRYKSDHQWKGELKKYSLDSLGNLGDLKWEAGKILAARPAGERHIWTVDTDIIHTTTNDNFRIANDDKLRDLLTENSPTLTVGQQQKIIAFIRGNDRFQEFSGTTDDDGDTIIEGERWKLADIYHSRAVAVGKPSALSSSSADDKTETYYRYANGYDIFKTGEASRRDEIIYVGSNGGMLHAFKSNTGDELWAFIPPSIIPRLKDVISVSPNSTKSIYGVDGDPVVKDIYYAGKWRTVLISGLRQGGNSYFALDVTDPLRPKHLFTFKHDPVLKKVSYWAADGTRTNYLTTGSIPAEYDYSKLGESWSKPLILRLPVGDNKSMKWTAVFGGGFNNGSIQGRGASLYVIDLEDGGKIIKNVPVSEIANNRIYTSVPPRVSAVIPDTSTNFQGSSMPSGAVVYFSDLEGQLWKVNLTDQGALYTTKKLFNAGSTATNGRYTFHENALSIGGTGALWQYYGSGNQQSLGAINPSIKNRLYAFRHTPAMTDFSSTMSTVADMADTSLSSCPTPTQKGWYFNLDANEKVTAKAAVKNAFVYFSIYTPNASNACTAGSGKLTEHSFSCGALEASFNLGQGVPTEAVVYKNKIYIGISTDESTASLPAGWTKEGNLIIGTPTNLVTGKVEVESWWEEF